jgi:bifunctional NMN adenylyltransferase/nudix hydrolase
MASKTDVSVYIGRFNPFHQGHAHVLRKSLETSKLTIVLIGSSGQARSLKNPFTFEERKSMILGWAQPSDNLVVLPLRDHPYNDTDWITEVQTKVKGAMTAFCLQRDTILTHVSITGSDRDDSTWYLHAFPQWKPALVPEHRLDGSGQVNATMVRRVLFDSTPESLIERADLANMLPRSTHNFLSAFIGSPEHTLLTQEYKANKAYQKAWSVAPYAPTFNTIDAVVIQSGHVLVVERGAFPGKGLWALPGGFLDQKERLQEGAIRELMEETGIRLAEGKNAEALTIKMLKGSIRDKEIFDKPDRSMRGRTITVGYLFRLDDTKPLPLVKGQNAPLHETNGVEEVETTKAFWIPISRALTETHMWFEDHHAIVEWAASVPDHR